MQIEQLGLLTNTWPGDEAIVQTAFTTDAWKT